MKAKTWKYVAVVGSLVVAKSLKSGLDKGYAKVTGKQPPVNIADPGTKYRDAILWTVLVSIIGGLGKLTFDTLMAHKWKSNAATPSQLANETSKNTKELVPS